MYVFCALLGASLVASFSTLQSRAQDASPGPPQTDNAWSLSTNRFDNSFEREPSSATAISVFA